MALKSAPELKTFFVGPFKAIDMGELIGKAFENKAEQILDLNKQQLDAGRDAQGKSLGRYKNFKYKDRFEPVDLKLKGDYREAFTLNADRKKGEIFSQDWKAPILEKRYGKNIEGINSQNKPTAAEIIKPELGKLIKDKLKI